MKFNKPLMKAAVVALAAMAAFACQEKPGEGEGESQLNEDLELAVDVEDITLTSAKVKVSHNGDKSDTWYGFLTEDVTSDEESLISDAVADYMNGDSSEGLRKSKSYVTVLKDLKPATLYRYIAFGLSSEGEVYGASASVEFETKVDSSAGGDVGDDGVVGNPEVDGMKLNPAWTATYIGEGVIEGVEYDHVVKVNSTDNNTYAITIVPASLWDVNVLYDEALLFVQDLVSYLDEFNQMNGLSLTLADVLYSGSQFDAFDLYPGFYRVVALGITTAGKVSGLYAVSDVFEVKEAIPSEKYKSWLGEWTIVGENDVEYTVTLSRHVTNRSFWMYGWEGFEDLPVDVEFSEERNDLTFYAQLVQENCYLEKYGRTGNLYFLGGDNDDYYYDIKDGEYAIAIAGILDDGQRALVRYGVNMPNYPTFVNMFYALEAGGEYSFFTASEDLPSFRGIAAINPAGAEPSGAMMRSQTLKRKMKK